MPEPPMEVDMSQVKGLNVDINQRVRFFDQPFAYIVSNKEVENFCSYCLQRPASGKLLYCAKCRYARYCDKACQKQAWRDHKLECGRLVKVFPNLPLTDVLFLSRVIDKVIFIKINGDKFNWQKDREFNDLMSHEEDMKGDEDRMNLWRKHLEKLQKFWGDIEFPDQDEVFQIFCRTWINSHSIHNSSGTEIGLALDLGVSRYNHSCRANGALVFDGFRAMIRPLVPKLDAADFTQTFISYIDIGKSKYVRRNELQRKWYFLCECERCTDPEDDGLTAISCYSGKCDEPIITTEDSEAINIACPRCGVITPEEKVKEAQQFMLSLPNAYAMDKSDENIDCLKKWLEQAKLLLHKQNIYYSRLLTAYYYVTGGTIGAASSEEDMHKIIYENYKRCFPNADRHVGYQILHLVKHLIQTGRREEATPYAYEAMTIFEICLGMSHPFYLQILALWTYLNNKEPKPDEYLLGLLSFEDRRPVELAPLLAKAESLAKELGEGEEQAKSDT